MSQSFSSLQPFVEDLGDSDTLAFLESLDISAMKLGLDRMRRFLTTVGNPQDTLPMVHVAGTNGKGSVTAMLSSVLQAAGYQTGRFISPHLIHVRERISINGNPILPDEFQYEISVFKAHLESLGWPRAEWPTYFEALTIIAYQYFRRKNVDITVFETGLGGRLDSTNVVRQPNLTVITTIGMDHMQHLGNTLAEIAREKAGILKEGVPLVVGASLEQIARQVICAQAAALGVPLYEADASLTIDTAKSTPERGLVVVDSKTQAAYPLSLLAPYQKDNLAIVLQCVQQLRQQTFQISESALLEGLRQTYWPVRFQLIDEGRIVLDGSHNEDGFHALQEALALYFPSRPVVWLLSLRNNRTPETLLQLIQTWGKPLALIFTQCEPAPLYHTPDALAELAKTTLGTQCSAIYTTPNPLEAFSILQERMAHLSGENPVGVITGSLYTAGAILAHVEGV